MIFDCSSFSPLTLRAIVAYDALKNPLLLTTNLLTLRIIAPGTLSTVRIFCISFLRICGSRDWPVLSIRRQTTLPMSDRYASGSYAMDSAVYWWTRLSIYIHGLAHPSRNPAYLSPICIPVTYAQDPYQSSHIIMFKLQHHSLPLLLLSSSTSAHILTHI